MKTEIEKAAFDYINSESVKETNMQLAFGDFINGAQWADKTMIEKACDWLYEELNSGDSYYDWNEFLDNFRKAMEY